MELRHDFEFFGDFSKAGEFAATVGSEHDFYGICHNQFKLGDTVWEAVEDPDDGGRSYLDSIQVAESDGIFFRNPVARVRVEAFTRGDPKHFTGDAADGFQLIDVSDGHIWLEVGTNMTINAYPCFIFRYAPKSESIDAHS